MSGPGDENMPERDDPVIAGEYALGLLEGDEREAARGKVEGDHDFAWRHDWWNNWFAPWADEIVPMQPGAEVWQRIERDIGVQDRGSRGPVAAAETFVDSDKARVVALERRVQRWQWTAALTSLAAAVLLALFVFAPGSEPVATPVDGGEGPVLAGADPLMASMPVGDSARLGVTYLPGTGEILVSASGVAGDGIHDHELWVVPADGGDLRSIGVIEPGAERRFTVPVEAANAMSGGVELVLTREPIGGKPEGEEAGPVVAQGNLSPV